jgi:transcriptional antiterminator Rof (Rho-off)
LSDYRPIACAFYDVFEIAVMRGQPLQLDWRDDSGERHSRRVQPRDLRIMDGAEYLIADCDGGEPLQLRLDRIDGATPVP